jgi:hypothetical protein
MTSNQQITDHHIWSLALKERWDFYRGVQNTHLSAKRFRRVDQRRDEWLFVIYVARCKSYGKCRLNREHLTLNLNVL